MITLMSFCRQFTDLGLLPLRPSPIIQNNEQLNPRTILLEQLELLRLDFQFSH